LHSTRSFILVTFHIGQKPWDHWWEEDTLDYSPRSRIIVSSLCIISAPPLLVFLLPQLGYIRGYIVGYLKQESVITGDLTPHHFAHLVK
jgi:hypothetical protein